MTIRDIEPERDAEAMATLIRSVNPSGVINAASWLHTSRTMPAHSETRQWVAEIDGTVAGRSNAFRRTFGTATGLYVAVFPEYRGRGIGSALFDVAIAHAEALGGDIVTDFFETPAGVRFAQARGFRETRAEQLAMLDPRTISERPRAEVRPMSEADLRDAHRIDEIATRDVPQHEPIESIPYAQWEAMTLQEPLFQPEGSFLAYANGEAAALSLLMADLESGRATNMFTGTLPERRGRGLGTDAKLASIHWAAAHGVTQIFTTNDESNAPMLAVNRRLGYEPLGRRVEYSRS